MKKPSQVHLILHPPPPPACLQAAPLRKECLLMDMCDGGGQHAAAIAGNLELHPRDVLILRAARCIRGVGRV